jgi:hypothetical protein
LTLAPSQRLLDSVFTDDADDFHSLQDLTENDVTAIEPASLDGGDELSSRSDAWKSSRTAETDELRAIGVFSGVGHGEETRTSVAELAVRKVRPEEPVMLQCLDAQVLIGELLAVDGLGVGVSKVLHSGEVGGHKLPFHRYHHHGLEISLNIWVL